MDYVKKQNGQKNHMTTSSYNRNPSSLGYWQVTVPSWEKKFCSTICSIPWHELLEAKKYMFLFNDVVQWDDSAGKEAFINAKTRFWAMINGFPCDIPLPGPDIYIDQIDWNSNIDPQLISDLKWEEDEPETHGLKNSILSSAFLHQETIYTGWGNDHHQEDGPQNSINLDSQTLIDNGSIDLCGSNKCLNDTYESKNFDQRRTQRKERKFVNYCCKKTKSASKQWKMVS